MRFTSDEANTIRFTTIARLGVSSVSINVVIEDKLFTSLYLTPRKNTHAKFVADHPLVHVAVRVAGVVAKPTEIAFLGGINKFILSQGHEIEVLDAFLVISDHTLSESRFVDDLSDIFEDEITRVEICICA